ncbi:MAG: sulfotransferase [Gammaproteobacteria bacterium]
MTLRVIGAGVGRTGTASLKAALERLLGGRCYHMFEVVERPQDIEPWTRAAHGEMPNWQRFLADFDAAVDWPAAAYWEELAAAFPEAIVLLSHRDPEAWWKSASSTIFPACREAEESPWRRMVFDMFAARFTADIDDRDAAIAAYEAHNARVRARTPPARLLEWQPGDGWQPLCTALGVPLPDEAFPHTNSEAEFLERLRARREGRR